MIPLAMLAERPELARHDVGLLIWLGHLFPVPVRPVFTPDPGGNECCLMYGM